MISTPLITIYIPIELRLVDGPSRCQGRLEIRPNSTVVYGQACDYDVGVFEAVVICRQLNCGSGIETVAVVPASKYVKMNDNAVM